MDTTETLVKCLCNPSDNLAGITTAVISNTVKEIQQWNGSSIGHTIIEDILAAVQDVGKTINGPDAIQRLFDLGFIHIISAIFQKISQVEKDDVCSQTLLEHLIHVLADLGAPVKSEITEKLIRHFMDVLENSKLRFQTRMEALKSTNILLEQCSTNVKESLLNRDDFLETLVKLKDLLFFIGDYEFQVGVVECLFRIFPKKLRKKYTTSLINDLNVAKQLLEIRDADFEMDCRNFLNELNSSCTRNRRVFSIPCISAHLGQKQLRKPSDSGYDQFWVDFNVGSERISMFCEQDQSECQESQDDDLWETISISKPDMRRCFSHETPGKFVINIEFIAPLGEIYPSQQSIHESTMKIEFPIEYTSIIEEAMKQTFRLGDESSTKQRKVSVVTEAVNISRIDESPIQLAEEFSPADICPPTQMSTRSQVLTTNKRKISVPCTPMRAPIHITTLVNNDRSSSLASIPTQPDTIATELVQDAHIMLKNKMESQQRKSSCVASSIYLKNVGKTPLAENEQAGSAKILSKRNDSSSKVKTPVVIVHPTANQKRSKKKDKTQLDNEKKHPDGCELNPQTICSVDKFAETISDSLQVPRPQDVTLFAKPTDNRLNLHDSGIDLNETSSLLDISKPKESLEKNMIASEKGIILQNDKEYATSSVKGGKKQLHGQIANPNKNNSRVSGKDEVSKEHTQKWLEGESNQVTDVIEENSKDKRSKMAGKMNGTNKHDHIEADSVDDFVRNQKEKTRKRKVKDKGNFVYSKTGGEISCPNSVMFAPLPVKLDESCKLRVSIHEEKGINREDVHLNLKNNGQISDMNQNEYQDGRRNKEKKKKRKETNEETEVSVSEETVLDDHLSEKGKQSSELNVIEDQGIKRNKETKNEKDTLSEEAVLNDIEPRDPVECLDYIRSKKDDLDMEKLDQDGEDYSSVASRVVEEASSKKIKTKVKGRKVKKKKESSEPDPKESDQLEEILDPKQVLNATNAEETENSFKEERTKDETIKVVNELTSSPKQNQKANIKKDTKFEKLLEAELQESSYVFNTKSSEDNKKNDKNETKESGNEKPERSSTGKERKTSDKSTIDRGKKKKRSLYSDRKDYLQEGKLTDDLEIPAFEEVFHNKDIVSTRNVKGTKTSSDTKNDKTSFSSKKHSRKDDGITKHFANLTCDTRTDENNAKYHQSEKFANKLAITNLSSSINKVGIESKNASCDNNDNSCNESCEDTFSLTTMTETAVQNIDESRMAVFMTYSAKKTYSHRSRVSNRNRPCANSDIVNEKRVSPDMSKIFSNRMQTSRINESKNSNHTGFMHLKEKVHKNHKDKCKEKSVAEYDPYDFELECERLSEKSERLVKCDESHAVFKKDNTSKNYKSKKSTKAKKLYGSLQHDKKTNIWKRKSLEKIEELKSGVNMKSHNLIDDGMGRGSSPNMEQKKSSSLKVEPRSECQKFQWEEHFKDCDIDNSKQDIKRNNRPSKNGQNKRQNVEMKSKTKESKLGKHPSDKNEIQKDFENDNSALKVNNKQGSFDDEFNTLEHEQLGISMDDETENRKKMEYHKKKKARDPPRRKTAEENDSRDTACQLLSTSSIVDNFSKIFQTIVSAVGNGDLENNDKNGKDRSIGKNDINEIVEEESCSDDQGKHVDKIKVQVENYVGSAKSKRKYGCLDISLVKTAQSLKSDKENFCSSEVPKSCSIPKQRSRRQKNPIVYKDLSDSEIDGEDSESDNDLEEDDQPEKDIGAGISDLDSFYKCDTNEKSWIKAFKDPQRKWRIKKTYTKDYYTSRQLEGLEKENVNEEFMDMLPTEPTSQDTSTDTPIITPCIKLMSAISTPGLKSKTVSSLNMNDTEDIEIVPSQMAMDHTSTVDTPYLKKLFSISENKQDEESDTEAEPVGNLLFFNKTIHTHPRGSEIKSGPSSQARLPKTLLKRKYPGIEDDSTPSASSQESCISKTEQETSHFVPRKLFKNFLPEADRNMQVELLSQRDSEEILTCTTEDEQLNLEVMCEAKITGVSKLMQTFGTDFQKHFKLKHQRLEMLGREAFGSVQNKLSQSWKDQRQHRNHFHYLFEEQMAKELGLLEQDINEIQEVESKVNDFFKQQTMMLRRNYLSQKQRLDNMKELQSTLKDWLQRAEKECDIRKGNNIEFLRNEMKNLQKKILIETQKEELLNVRRCLQNLF